MNFTDLNSVISQVVVDNIRKVLAACEETEDTAIVVKELLLRGDFATTKSLLKELLHFRVSLGWYLDQRLSKVVNWALLCWWEFNALGLKYEMLPVKKSSN